MKTSQLAVALLLWAISSACFYFVGAALASFAMLDTKYFSIAHWDTTGRALLFLMSMASFIIWSWAENSAAQGIRERRRQE